MNAVTLNLSKDLNNRLAYLAQQTGQTLDFHFQQALEAYLAKTESQKVAKKREVPVLSAEDRALFGGIYQTSAQLDENYFYQKLGIK